MSNLEEVSGAWREHFTSSEHEKEKWVRDRLLYDYESVSPTSGPKLEDLSLVKHGYQSSTQVY